MRSKTVWKSERAQLAGAATVVSVLALAGGSHAATGAAHVRPPERVEIVTSKGVRSFSVEIADTDASRELGLMFRRHLAPDRGMLFEFDRPDVQSFWMKNTLIPLDIIYIGADGRIVSIARDARPLDETPLYSTGPAKGVLEIEGGLSAKLDIEPGDKVEHPFFHTK